MVLYERDTKLYRHSTIFSFHHRLVRFFCSAKVSRLRIAHVAQQHGPLTMITAAPCMMHVHQTIVSTFFSNWINNEYLYILPFYHYGIVAMWHYGPTFSRYSPNLFSSKTGFSEKKNAKRFQHLELEIETFLGFT